MFFLVSIIREKGETFILATDKATFPPSLREGENTCTKWGEGKPSSQYNGYSFLVWGENVG